MTHFINDRAIQRKKYIAGLLELACQELELPQTKRKAGERAYDSVSEWLNECPALGQFRPLIFPQGSMALGTTVKPLNREEFDVDLVCLLTLGTESLQQAGVKRAVGDRLAAHRTYAEMLEEYKRCWRLDYAKEAQLHLDITPAVKNSLCANGGLCVTDKEARAWQPTHPKGYIEWFDFRAALQPEFRTPLVANRAEIEAKVEPLPEQLPLKGLLRRTVQLLKRHRSIYFAKLPERAPISIILTTLAAKAYAEAASSGNVYDTEFDLVCDVIDRMPTCIERRWNNSRLELWVPNETTNGENFAEKWNRDPALAQAFNEWHGAAIQHFRALAEAADAETAFLMLDSLTGKSVAAAVRSRATEAVSRARVQQLLRAGSSGALSVSVGVPVRSNTFFGA